MLKFQKGQVSSSLLAATLIWIALLVASISGVDRNCQDIKTLKQDIFWIGLLKSRFVLITSTYAVYDLPTNALDNTRHKLYLTNPRQMADIYPKLWKKMNEDATGFFKGNQFRLTVVDEKSDYLYAESADRTKAQLYNLKTGEPYEEYKVKDELRNDQSPMLVMSSNEALYFYGFYFSDSDDTSGRIIKGRFLDQTTVRTSTTVQFVGKELHVCQVGTTSDQISLQPTDCKGDAQVMNSKNGFVDSYNFYIMATNRTVAVFSKAAYDRYGTPVRVYLIRYEDFFICGGNPMLMYIIAAVVGVVVFCCCCFGVLLLCCRKKGSGGGGRGPLLVANLTPAVMKKEHSRSHSHLKKKRSSNRKGGGRSKSTVKSRKKSRKRSTSKK